MSWYDFIDKYSYFSTIVGDVLKLIIHFVPEYYTESRMGELFIQTCPRCKENKCEKVYLVYSRKFALLRCRKCNFSFIVQSYLDLWMWYPRGITNTIYEILFIEYVKVKTTEELPKAKKLVQIINFSHDISPFLTYNHIIPRLRVFEKVPQAGTRFFYIDKKSGKYYCVKLNVKLEK